jgi:hypothetical protein
VLNRPAWINFGNANRQQLRFVWDDARVHEDYTADASQVLHAALRMIVRARMVLAVGLYEWIVWRFDGLHNHPEPRQALEAAWCSTVDPRYLAFRPLVREDWVGPVDGPLWCGVTYLQHGLPKGYDLEGDLYDALALMYQLAVHVCPRPSELQRWLTPTLERLMTNFPVTLVPANDYEDLFGHRIGEHMGPLIGRDVLDPALPLAPNRDRQFLAQLLADTNAARNPFLATPADLDDLDFEGTPYVLPPP